MAKRAVVYLSVSLPDVSAERAEEIVTALFEDRLEEAQLEVAMSREEEE